jgi:hypothetical protein
MTTKDIISAQVLDLLTKGKQIAKESSFNKQYTIRLIESVFNNKVRTNYYEQRQLDGEYELPAALYSVYDDVLIHKDSKRGVMYVTLPGILVSVPANRCLKIGPMQDEESEFKQMYGNAVSAWNTLESSRMNGYISYYVEGRRAVFRNMADDWEGKEVLVKMIVNLSSIDEDSPIPMPEDWESEIIQSVYNMYVQQHNLEEDLTNDNN